VVLGGGVATHRFFWEGKGVERGRDNTGVIKNPHTIDCLNPGGSEIVQISALWPNSTSLFLLLFVGSYLACVFISKLISKLFKLLSTAVFIEFRKLEDSHKV
jgi:hypothetical protein